MLCKLQSRLHVCKAGSTYVPCGSPTSARLQERTLSNVCMHFRGVWAADLVEDVRDPLQTLGIQTLRNGITGRHLDPSNRRSTAAELPLTASVDKIE